MAIYERPPKSGNWHVDITINKIRYRKAIPEARNKKQAEKAERVLRDEIFNKRFGIGGDKLFKDFVEQSFIPHAKANHKGFYTELSKINKLIETFGAKRLHEITPEIIEQFKRKARAEITIRGKVRAPASVDRILAVLSGMFRLAVRFGEVKDNPMKRVEYFHQPQTKDRVLSEKEESILFEALKDEIHFSRTVEILLYTGMRRGEMFQLEWRDVNFTDGFINIRGETTKSGKPRVVPMFARVQKILESIRDEAGTVSQFEQVFVKAKPRGEYLSKRFTDICKDLGIDGVTIHTLRHTFSTRAFESGIQGLAHKALMGHSSLYMTDRYTHVTPEMLKDSLSLWKQASSHKTDTENTEKEKENVESPKILRFKKREKN